MKGCCRNTKLLEFITLTSPLSYLRAPGQSLSCLVACYSQFPPQFVTLEKEEEGILCNIYQAYLLSWIKMKCKKHKWFISDLTGTDPVIQTGPAAPCHKRTTGEDPCQDVNQPEQVYNTDNLAPIVAPILISISFDTPPLSLWQCIAWQLPARQRT